MVAATARDLDLHESQIYDWRSKAQTQLAKSDLEGVIVHTDRGRQYCSAAYQALLKRHEMLCSMSGKGCCYDNACAESFFHMLKVELVHGEGFGQTFAHGIGGF